MGAKEHWAEMGIEHAQETSCENTAFCPDLIVSSLTELWATRSKSSVYVLDQFIKRGIQAYPLMCAVWAWKKG